MAVASTISAEKLLKQFRFCEEEYNKKVTDRHLLDISRSYFEKWRSLYPYLDMTKTDVTNAEKDGNGEENERQKFLERWQEKKGCDATYIKLINALLEVECRSDAEGVCKLLQQDETSPKASPMNVSTSPPTRLVQPGISLVS